MSPTVGGTPWAIATGAGKLGDVAKAIHDDSPGVKSNATTASGAAGDPTVAAAIDRFAAAFGTYTSDLAAQFGAASTLAIHGSQDLAAAGGGGPDRPR